MIERILAAGIAAAFAAPASAEIGPISLDTSAVASELYVLQDEDTGEPIGEQGWLDGWEGNARVGLNGSTGNTERFNVRAGTEVVRFVGQHESTIRLTYTYAKENSNITEQKFRALGRHDYLFDDSPWRVFGEAVYDYDQFQSWKHRVSLRAGGGYTFIDTDETFLLGRIGLAATKDLQGPENEWRPEVLIGGDWTHDITDKQSIEVHADFFFNVSDVGGYRFEGRAEYQILLDEESNLSFVAGVEDRYDSRPGGAKRNDLDYYMLLSWAF